MMLLPYFAVTTSSSVTDIVLAIVGIIGVIGIVGGASSYFYKGRADALIDLQKEENQVLKDTVNRLKEQNVKLKDERTELIVEIKRMRTEIKTLRGLITQPKQLQELAATLAKQHTQVIDKLTDIAGGIVNEKSK